MPGAYLFASTDGGTTWIPVKINASGQLIVDPSALFENPPTEDETKKGPSSEWAFDHAADAAAHHARYTDAESRAAIANLFSSTGLLTKTMHCNWQALTWVQQLKFWFSGASTKGVVMQASLNSALMRFVGNHYITGNEACYMQLYDGVDYQYVIDAGTFPTYFAALLENPPTEDETGKAPTSEWAFDHKADASAHHAKYTDLEAQAACGLSGGLFWSASGRDFRAANPLTDDISYNSSNGSVTANANGIYIFAPVHLPEGVTVTSVNVHGNTGAEGETYQLLRITKSSGVATVMATDNIGTEDTSITNPYIDNETYAYVLQTSSIDNGDSVYGATIGYEL